MKRDSRRAARALAFHLLSAGIALLFVIPLWWMVVDSLRPLGLPPPRAVEWWPAAPAWSNYARLFTLLPFGRYLLNSLLVGSLAVPLTLLTASWAGFAMAQFGERGRARLLALSLLLLMVPVAALWLTRFVLFKAVGWFNTYAALLAPSLMGSSPLFSLLFYWTFRRVPAELYEAARLEGASAWAMWWRVGLPLARATLVAVGVLAFMLYWSDFISPLLYLKSPALYTLPVGLRQLQELDRTHWPLLMAGAVLMTAPTVILFAVVQRFFLQESRLAGIYGE